MQCFGFKCYLLAVNICVYEQKEIVYGKVVANCIYRHALLTLYMSLSVRVSLGQLTLMK